jgi:hypothetical protein
LEELKRELEKTLKTELSTKWVKMIMDEFDVSGDGKLQIDEMVAIDQFRNKLAFIVQEEKRLAKEAVIAAKQEEELAKLAEARNQQAVTNFFPYFHTYSHCWIVYNSAGS